MQIIQKKWFQLVASFTIGALLGVWQYIPAAKSLPSDISSSKAQSIISKLLPTKLNKTALKDTAAIEPLLALKPPEKDASVHEWYDFALSLDDLDLGKRYGNRGQTTPMLSWYAYIAKYKPQAIYKLYNQGKLGNIKFEHLLQFGFLKYWDEYVNDVDKLLLSENQTVLSMAYEKGVDVTRRRVSQAFFKVSNDDFSSHNPNLEIENLLFAMKSMTDDEKVRVKEILEMGIFDIDPRFLYHLKLSDIFADDSTNEALVALIEKYAKRGSYDRRSMSIYMVDGAILGNKKYIETMVKDLETNAKQPTNFYCAACGIALSADGLMAYPLINASKKGKVEVNANPDGQFILSRKSLW
ncbi:MAG: hypothetical protein V7749_17885 [Cocleimonas sp.]